MNADVFCVFLTSLRTAAQHSRHLLTCLDTVVDSVAHPCVEVKSLIF